MLTARLYIASPQPALEALLAQDPHFSFAGGSGDGREALGQINALAPDLALVDGALPTLDGYALLDGLRHSMAAPPRALFLSRMPGPRWERLAYARGADDVVPWPADPETLRLRAVRAAQLPLPALAAPRAADRLQIAEQLLGRLGTPRTLKGYAYMRDAAALAACAPQLTLSYSARLYPLLAGRFATTPQAVERAIRAAVEHTWLYGDLGAIQALFGFSVDAERGKPTNAELIAMLAEHTRRETARLLARAAGGDSTQGA